MKARIIYLTILLFTIPSVAFAMHIAEGFLPPSWSLFYLVLCIPFIYLGLKDIKEKTDQNKELKMLLGLVGAFCFVLSALKLPSVTGSSSHPTGTGFGAIVFGPKVMAVVSTVVLLFQALFLAHGGITTLGANVFSMGIVGPIVSYLIYRALKNNNEKLAIFLSAVLGDLATYLVTSIQLASAFPDKTGGVFASFIKFASIFGITQIPVAIIEGILTVAIINFANKYSSAEIKLLRGGQVNEK